MFKLRPLFIQSTKLSRPTTKPATAYSIVNFRRTMATENPAKKLKVDAPLIGTHSGHFHADESLAVAMLRLLPSYLDSQLVRTRDPAVLSTCHTVVDVGGEYDDTNKRYDHHQRGFETVFPGHSTKLSSAGLVYLHFGKDIITTVTGLQGQDRDILFEKLYTDFIEAFDANDNGVNAFAPKDLEKAGLQKKFEDRGFSIASVVNRYNYGPRPASTEETKTPEAKQAEEDMRFSKASQFVGEQFLLELTDRANSWLPARHQVKQAYDARLQYDPQGRILVLPEGMPWSDHLYSLEKEVPLPQGVAPQVLYVLFPEDQPEGKWRIRAVSKENGGFENRKDLPDAWKGVRDEQLDQVSGIPGCVFVHAAGFIGGNKSFDGALAMAKKALEL
ncbi:MYG1 protein-like protein [Pyrenochaeta sp. MPI-SDFR-AT-0127]|nr:MYG1 protein-like protein [Pyrenochaeta sp. MPI-SDFR-AT-0127]